MLNIERNENTRVFWEDFRLENKMEYDLNQCGSDLAKKQTIVTSAFMVSCCLGYEKTLKATMKYKCFIKNYLAGVCNAYFYLHLNIVRFFFDSCNMPSMSKNVKIGLFQEVFYGYSKNLEALKNTNMTQKELENIKNKIDQGEKIIRFLSSRSEMYEVLNDACIIALETHFDPSIANMLFENQGYIRYCANVLKNIWVCIKIELQKRESC